MKPQFTVQLSPSAARKILSILTNAKLVYDGQVYEEDAVFKVRAYLNKEINRTLGQTRSTLIKFLSMDDEDLIGGISAFVESFVDDLEKGKLDEDELKAA